MKEFFEFCRKRIDLLILNISIVAVVYGCRIFNLSVTMDTDLFINTPRSVYNWLDIGRYGLIFTEKIFGIRWYNPYINSTLGFFAIVAFLMMFAYSFEYISGRENRYNYFVFSALFMTHPIWVMQWVFKLQNFDIAISILLVAIAVYLTFSWIKCRAVWRLLLAIGCLVWSFGSYQANTTLFIAAVAFGILICKETDLKKLFLVCVKAVVPFGCAYILNSIIVKMFFSSGDYIEGQVLWGNVSAEQCIINIIQHIKQVFFVYKDYIYGYGAVVLSICAVVMLVIWCKSAIKIPVWKWVAILVLIISPFMLTVYAGVALAYRSQYTLPFVIAVGFVYLTRRRDDEAVEKKKSINKIVRKTIQAGVLIAAIAVGLSQTYTTLRFWYADDVRYEQDVDTLNEIVTRCHIKDYDLQKSKIAFIGERKAPLNNACYPEIDFIGMSYFNMFAWMEPEYYYSTGKICTFALTRGIELNGATQEEIARATNFAKNMPAWPANDAIQKDGDLIIVKMGEIK